MLVSPVMPPEVLKREPEPYCNCWSKRTTVSWQQLDPCECGEVSTECEWTWDTPAITGTSWLVLSEDRRQVTFHPFYSSGTAVVKGDTPFELNNHYYWEVKVLTETYGTDIIVGVGTNKMDITSAQFNFTSLLGNSEESYGLSYTGCLRHNDMELPNAGGFCRGTIIGVRVDMWRGTLEYYLNRKPQGICFYNLRRHERLYPMISSTAAQSSMRLVYAGSWRGSLLVDAIRILTAGVRSCAVRDLPPGLRFLCTSKFWLTLPSDGQKNIDEMEQPRETLKSCYSMEDLPSEYINGYYVDGVEPNYRIVVWQSLVNM